MFRIDAFDILEVTVPVRTTHALLFLLGYIALRIFYLFWLHPLSNTPGPKLAALTDLWKTRAVWKEEFSTALHKQHARHGDVVRIGPNEVSIIAPDEVTNLYGPHTEFAKGPFYDAWALMGKNLFSDRDGTTHGLRRRAVTAAYSINHLTPLEKYCDSCTDLLFSHFDKISESGSVADMSKFIEWYAYDAVGGIAFGKYFGLLQTGGDTTGMLSILAQGTESIVTAATLTNFGWILSTEPVKWLTSKILGEKGPNFFIGYSTRIVEERQALRATELAAYEEGKDMLYQFMESKDLETLEPLDSHELINNVGTIIVAGADTTKTSMVAFLRYVYAHPPTLERLRQEMDDAVTAGDLTFPVTYAQATHLEFMWACIKEALRLHPAVGMTLQRVVPAGGRVISGRFYPAGTLVGMSAREVQYDTRAYGKDAGEWRPERWLDDDHGELEKFNLVFGQGSRVCIGKHISLMEMSKLLPAIVYHYDIRIKNPENPWKVRESWFTPQYDFLCSITKREYYDPLAELPL